MQIAWVRITDWSHEQWIASHKSYNPHRTAIAEAKVKWTELFSWSEELKQEHEKHWRIFVTAASPDQIKAEPAHNPVSKTINSITSIAVHAEDIA